MKRMSFVGVGVVMAATGLLISSATSGSAEVEPPGGAEKAFSCRQHMALADEATTGDLVVDEQLRPRCRSRTLR